MYSMCFTGPMELVFIWQGVDYRYTIPGTVFKNRLSYMQLFFCLLFWKMQGGLEPKSLYRWMFRRQNLKFKKIQEYRTKGSRLHKYFPGQILNSVETVPLSHILLPFWKFPGKSGGQERKKVKIERSFVSRSKTVILMDTRKIGLGARQCIH
jgi:hypothetical protein